MNPRTLYIVILLALTAVGAGSAYPNPDPAASIRSDGLTQGPDPNKKDIITFAFWSPETETIGLKARFPDDAQNVKVSLYNILGRLIDAFPPQPFAKNDFIRFPFSGIGLPSGPYIIVLEANGQRIVNKVVLSR